MAFAESYGLPRSNTFFVTLFSFTNAASRPTFGWLSDACLARYGFPRTGWLAVLAAVLAAAFAAAALLLECGAGAAMVLPPLILVAGTCNGAVAFLEPVGIHGIYSKTMVLITSDYGIMRSINIKWP